MSLLVIKAVADALTGIEGLEVGHYEYYGPSKDCYCVWSEDSEQSSVEGDNYKVNQAIQGTIDLFTKEEFSPFFDAIQDALKAARISFYFNSFQYEDETQLLHYEWIWSVGT